LAAATKGTALEGEETRLLFEGMSSAAATLALDSQDVEGAFRAITQIVDKSVVSMEELRQQLGERLTGAFKLAADSMGIAREDLDELVSSGNLAAEVFLPRFSRELIKVFGGDIARKTDTTTAAINRFNNALFGLSVDADDSFIVVFKDSLNEITSALKDPNFKTGVKLLLDLASVTGGVFTDKLRELGLFSTLVGEMVRQSNLTEEQKDLIRAGADNQTVRVKSTRALPSAVSAIDPKALKRLAEVEKSLLSETELIRSNTNDQIQIVQDAEVQKIIAREEANSIILSLESKQAAELEKIETKRQAMRLNKASEFFGNFSQLVFSENKKLARIGQAAAIAEATISTFVAANKALSAFPPPFNVIAMAGALATGFANVQAIKSQGFQQGGFPFIGGQSFSGDQRNVNVNSGEVILNGSQQRNFMRMANGGGGGTTIIVKNFGVETTTETRRGSDGQDVTVLTNRIKREVTSDVTQDFLSGGQISRAAESSYGLRRGG